MSVSLQKGQRVSLSKDRQGLTNLVVGLGWDEVPRKMSFFSKPAPIDCDASALLLKNGKIYDEKEVVYFKNLVHNSGCVRHLGDNLTGAGDGDDELIVIELSKVPQEFDAILVFVNIYQALERRQHFGMIENAFIRIVDASTNQEILRYNLTDDYQNMTAIICGEVYKHGGEWKFNAIGQGTNDAHVGQVVERYS